MDKKTIAKYFAGASLAPMVFTGVLAAGGNVLNATDGIGKDGYGVQDKDFSSFEVTKSEDNTLAFQRAREYGQSLVLLGYHEIENEKIFPEKGLICSEDFKRTNIGLYPVNSQNETCRNLTDRDLPLVKQAVEESKYEGELDIHYVSTDTATIVGPG